MEEKLAALVPRYIAEVTRYDDPLEDIPTRQAYTSTGKYIKMSAEVLFDRFGARNHRLTSSSKKKLLKVQHQERCGVLICWRTSVVY